MSAADTKTSIIPNVRTKEELNRHNQKIIDRLIGFIKDHELVQILNYLIKNTTYHVSAVHVSTVHEKLCEAMCGSGNLVWECCVPIIATISEAGLIIDSAKDLTLNEVAILNYSGYYSVINHINAILAKPTINKIAAEFKTPNDICTYISILNIKNAVLECNISNLCMYLDNKEFTKSFDYITNSITDPKIQQLIFTRYFPRLMNVTSAKKYLSTCPEEFKKLEVTGTFINPSVYKSYLQFVGHFPLYLTGDISRMTSEYLRHAIDYGFDPTSIMDKFNVDYHRGSRMYEIQSKNLEVLVQNGYLPNFLTAFELLNYAQDSSKGLIAIRNKFGDDIIQIPVSHYSWLSKYFPINIPIPVVRIVFEYGR